MKTAFLKFGKLTVFSIILLIFIGGVVRASGSGMGCPDWPKCFGSWIPPTSVDQLPVNYKSIFGAKLKGEVIFNPIKTWIEYFNRLVGALIGIFVFITFVLAIKHFWNSSQRVIVYLCGIAWILVGIEGGLGARVVSSELHPVMVSIHMLLSIIILGLLILALLKANTNLQTMAKPELSFLLVLTMLICLGQILLGTQIREMVDAAQKSLGESNRSLWLENAPAKLFFHGGLSIILMAFLFFVYQQLKGTFLHIWAKRSLILTALSVISGIVLGFLGMPAFAQPFHLVLAICILANLFVLYFHLQPKLFKN